MPRFRVGDIVRLAPISNGSAAFARFNRTSAFRVSHANYSMCNLHGNRHETMRVQLWDPESGSVLLGSPDDFGGFCSEAFVFANGDPPTPPCQHITYPYCVCGGTNAR